MFLNRMQSLDDPWTEEESDASDHPYYNNISSKTPPSGRFADTRLKTKPQAPDAVQVALLVYQNLFSGLFCPVFARKIQNPSPLGFH